MADYSIGLIYVITSGEHDLYVGSTTNFHKRKIEHIYCLNTPSRVGHNRKLYRTIRANNNNYKIVKLYDFPCYSKEELQMEEERIRLLLKANLNSRPCYMPLEQVLLNKQIRDSNYNLKRRLKRKMQAVFDQLIELQLDN